MSTFEVLLDAVKKKGVKSVPTSESGFRTILTGIEEIETDSLSYVVKNFADFYTSNASNYIDSKAAVFTNIGRALVGFATIYGIDLQNTQFNKNYLQVSDLGDGLYKIRYYHSGSPSNIFKAYLRLLDPKNGPKNFYFDNQNIEIFTSNALYAPLFVIAERGENVAIMMGATAVTGGDPMCEVCNPRVTVNGSSVRPDVFGKACFVIDVSTTNCQTNYLFLNNLVNAVVEELNLNFNGIAYYYGFDRNLCCYSCNCKVLAAVAALA